MPSPSSNASGSNPTVWRKQNVVAVRHVSGDRLVAIVEVVSRGNTSGRKAFEDSVRKAAEFLSHQIHLLVLDLQPPTSRDPQGIHGAIWDEVAGLPYNRPDDKPLTLAAYEAGDRVCGLRRTGRRGRLPDRHAAVPRAGPPRRGAPRGDLLSRV